MDLGEEVPVAVDGFGLGGEFGVLRVDGVSDALQQFRLAGIGAPKGGEMLNHFAEQVRGGVRVDDVVDAFPGDDERVAEGLAFRSVDPRLIGLVEPGWVLALIVGCEVADDEGIGGPAQNQGCVVMGFVFLERLRCQLYGIFWGATGAKRPTEKNVSVFEKDFLPNGLPMRLGGTNPVLDNVVD